MKLPVKSKMTRLTNLLRKERALPVHTDHSHRPEIPNDQRSSHPVQDSIVRSQDLAENM